MPIELGFVLMRLAEMAEADESLRDRQPWKTATETDYAWLGNAVTKHYHGDDTDAKMLLGGWLQAFAGPDGRRVLRGGARLPAPREAPHARAAVPRDAATCR